MHLARQSNVLYIIWPTSCVNCWMQTECQQSANCCSAFWFITVSSQQRIEDGVAFGIQFCSHMPVVAGEKHEFTDDFFIGCAVKHCYHCPQVAWNCPTSKLNSKMHSGLIFVTTVRNFLPNTVQCFYDVIYKRQCHISYIIILILIKI